ncbi:MAG: transposase [Candidatus Rokubacteria bacterium]|nr:transposase [Candidatus Rokubacteria bacterium]
MSPATSPRAARRRWPRRPGRRGRRRPDWPAGTTHLLLTLYTRRGPTASPRFHRTTAPTDAEIAELLTRLHRRVRRLLARRGRLPEEALATDPVADQAPLFAHTVAASRHGRVALGPRAGQPLRRLRSAASARTTAPRCARLEGFRLHADVGVPAPRRDRLERLCRSLLRPPLALDRLTETTGGQLLSQFRRPWPAGTTPLLLTPL